MPPLQYQASLELMKITDIIQILRKNKNHYLWNKRKHHFTLADWVELDKLKNDYKPETYGKGTDKRVLRISDGVVYANGKECYEANGINRSSFYHLIGGRTKKKCDFKYIK